MLPEGKKAEWIAKNQGDKLHYVMKDRNESKWLKKSVSEVAEEFEKHGGRYAPYLVKLYFLGDIKKIEDLYRMQPLLKLFDKVKNRLQNRDINSYKSLNDLKSALEPYQESISTKHVDPAKDKLHFESGEMTRLIKTPTFEVIVPHTQTTSCLLGKGTDWCTAADDAHNMWRHYAKEGNLYVIRAGDKRFQMQIETESFMDEKDERVGKEDIAYLSKFPEWKTFLDALIVWHYNTEAGPAATKLAQSMKHFSVLDDDGSWDDEDDDYDDSYDEDYDDEDDDY